jgi:hypothetical protein
MSHTLCSPVNPSVDVAFQSSALPGAAPVILDRGAAILLAPRAQLDMSAGAGLRGAALRTFVAVGISARSRG